MSLFDENGDGVADFEEIWFRLSNIFSPNGKDLVESTVIKLCDRPINKNNFCSFIPTVETLENMALD
jgi:hypothetical protein